MAGVPRVGLWAMTVLATNGGALLWTPPPARWLSGAFDEAPASWPSVTVRSSAVSRSRSTSRGGSAASTARWRNSSSTPRPRGLQLGPILMERASADARRHGCAEMGPYLVASTEGNRGFYEKLGFEVTGTEMRCQL